MGTPAVPSALAYLVSYIPILAAILILSAVAAGIWWLLSRRRMADETLARAQAEADRLIRQAERDAETLRKEAALEAREKAHAVAAETDKEIRQRRDEIASLELTLSEKTRSLTDRLASCDRLEKDLGVRTEAITKHEAAAATARTRADQLLAERHRELQRVAGLSADEARELLLKHIEGRRPARRRKPRQAAGNRGA